MNLDKRIVGAAVLSLAALFVWRRGESKKKNEAPSVILKAEKIKKGSMSEKRIFSGVLKAEKSINIISEKSVKIKNIKNDGEFVKAGELIMELFDDAEKNAVLSAEAVLLDKESQYARAKKLYDEKIISDADLSGKESEYKRAKADYQRALSELSKMIFKAPFDGVLGLVKYNVGSILPYNQEATTFFSYGPLNALFSVPESYKSDVKRDLEVDIYPDKQNSIPKIANVIAYEPQADSTHSIMVKAKLQDIHDDLIPGQFVRVSVPLGMKHGVIMCPEAAIRAQQGSAYVFKVENGKANRAPVTVGIRDDGYVEIMEGLSEGDIVIVESGDSLDDGLKVKPQLVEDTEKSSEDQADNSTGSKN